MYQRAKAAGSKFMQTNNRLRIGAFWLACTTDKAFSMVSHSNNLKLHRGLTIGEMFTKEQSFSASRITNFCFIL